MLLKPGSYMNALPTAADVLLIVEVSDTALDYDRDVELNLYARHGIPEVWLMDVSRNELLVYREPVDGPYRLMRRLSAHDVACPEAAPEISVRLSELAGWLSRVVSKYFTDTQQPHIAMEPSA